MMNTTTIGGTGAALQPSAAGDISEWGDRKHS